MTTSLHMQITSETHVKKQWTGNLLQSWPVTLSSYMSSRNPIKCFSNSKTKFWKPLNPVETSNTKPPQANHIIDSVAFVILDLLTSKVEPPNSPNRVCSKNCHNEAASNNYKEGNGGGNTNPNLLAPNGRPKILTCASLYLPTFIH